MQIDEDLLLDLIINNSDINFLVKELIIHPDLIPLLINISTTSHHPKSWYAAWIADKINTHHSEYIFPYIHKITEHLKIENNNSKIRIFLKIISLHPISSEYDSFLLNYCINCLTDINIPISIKVHSMQILYNLTLSHPSLTREVYELLDYEIRLHPSAGIVARGKKLLKKLKKNSTTTNYIDSTDI